jgi:tripartite-type tricarboxylate transporter receptor subunit TctC
MRFDLCIVSMALAALPCAATAQSYATKPVRIVVPFPPGGGSDVLGRIIAQKLTEQIKQQVLVENRAGAGGTIGTEMAVRAAPDAYTLLFGSASEIAVNPFVYTRLTYDPARDLAAIAMVATTPLVVVVHPSLPVAGVKDLIALAKARPREINMASAGSGTFTHLAGELFMSSTATRFTHVPYKGVAPALTDLAGGQVQLVFVVPPAVTGLIAAGKLKAIAVAGSTRAAALPAIPTVAEAGVPSYEAVQWWGMFVTAGAPKELVAQLHAEIARALRAPDLVASFQKQGVEPGALSQQQFVDFVSAEVAKWGKVAKATGIALD